MNFNSVLLSIVLIVAGYLIGSIPSGFLIGKWVKGIDIRDYGSGTVSGSMVWEHVARWAIIPVLLFDILKAAFPTWLGLSLGVGVVGSTLAGLAAVVGHNWPIYLKFTGGRGLSPFIGVLLVIFPIGALWMLVFLVVGFFIGDSAPWALTSLITLPLLVHWTDGPIIVNWAAFIMVFITLLKRFEANGRLLPTQAKDRWRVILLRLFFDRDIRTHVDWIDRKPTND
jgi:glycerol-3-phosphate acyltransferase PlsY